MVLKVLRQLSYEFINHKTGHTTPVSSMWNFKRLNGYKSIDLRTDGNYLTNLYTYNTTTIAYKDNGNRTNNFVGTGGGENQIRICRLHLMRLKSYPFA